MSRIASARSVSIIIKPSFSDKRSVYYEEFYVDGKRQHIIGGAIAQADTPDPQTWQRELSESEAKKFKDVLQRLTIALEFTSPSCGLDGTRWEFQITSGTSCIRLEWWNDLPPGWNSLKDLTHTMIMMARAKEPPKWWNFGVDSISIRPEDAPQSFPLVCRSA